MNSSRLTKSEKRRADFRSCRACKPNSVPAPSRPRLQNAFAEKKGRGTVIPLGRTLLHGSSDLPGSCDAPSQHVPAGSPVPRALHGLGEPAGSSPIWSCSVWGFPCHRHCWQRGALLPHLFTLTPPNFARSRNSAGGKSWAGRYIFCGTFRQRRLNGAARTLSGTLLSGVRTFLCQPAQPDLPAVAGSAKRNNQCSQAGSDRPAQQLTLVIIDGSFASSSQTPTFGSGAV